MTTVPANNLARNYHEGRLRPCRLIVWHDMEMNENDLSTAEKCLRYFHTTERPASAHLCADQNSFGYGVDEDDTAFAAPGANSDGYQVELAGFARQTPYEWLDLGSRSTIKQAARGLVPVIKKFAIPHRWLTDDQLRSGTVKGHTTHAQVSRVFRKSTHTDPGTGFPKDFVMSQVVAAIGGSIPPKKPTPTKPVITVPPFPRELGDDGVIKFGDRGREVVAVQNRFRQRGANIEIDGVFGSGTQHIVTDFQRGAGTAPDGAVGPTTWRLMWTFKVG